MTAFTSSAERSLCISSCAKLVIESLFREHVENRLVLLELVVRGIVQVRPCRFHRKFRGSRLIEEIYGWNYCRNIARLKPMPL